jgi:peptidoglycan hydrolase-like protein with peptidoglycan-binding domain
MRKIIIFFILSLVFAGCDLHKKQRIQEQEILGPTDKYNLKVEEAQRALMEAGFESGLIDGRMGWQTRNAVREFQRMNQLPATGFIDAQTWNKLRSESLIFEDQGFLIEPSEEIETAAQPEVFVKPPRDDSSNPGTALKEKAVDKRQEIREKLKSTSWIKKIQVALKKSGFDPGPIDGKIGKKTKKAIVEFQNAKGLKPDGVIGIKTWEELSRYFEKE